MHNYGLWLYVLCVIFIVGLVFWPGCASFTVTDKLTRSATSQPGETPSVAQKRQTEWKGGVGAMTPPALPAYEGTDISAKGAVHAGGTDWFQLVGEKLKGMNIIYIIGAIAILGGVALAVALKQYLLGGAIAGAGLVLIGLTAAAQAHPGWLLLVPVVLIIAGMVVAWKLGWFVKVQQFATNTKTGIDEYRKAQKVPEGTFKTTPLGQALKAAQDGPNGTDAKVLKKLTP